MAKNKQKTRSSEGTPLMRRALEVCILADIPVILIGPPGSGKTETLRSIGRSLGLFVSPIVAADPIDVQGIPALIDGEVRRSLPVWLRLIQASGQKGIAFCDEMNVHGGPAVMEAYLQLWAERMVGEARYPSAFVLVGAMNPPEQTASGLSLPPALANRAIHLNWQLDVRAWSNALVSGFPDEPVEPLGEFESLIPRWRTLIAAFAMTRPMLVKDALPTDETLRSGPWPSPRTWTIAARALAAAEKSEGSVAAFGGGGFPLGDLAIELLQGAVGTAAATELASYLVNLDLPDPEVVLATPGMKLPDRSDALFACVNAVTQAVLDKPTKERRDAALAVFTGVADSGQPDMVIPSLRRMVPLFQRFGAVPSPLMKSLVPLAKAMGLA